MGTTEKRIKAEKENSTNSDNIQTKILKWSRITAIAIVLTLLVELSPHILKLLKLIASTLK